MAYDLPLDRVKIRSPFWRKRETGLPSFGQKLKLERENARSPGADFRLHQDRNPHAASAGRGQIQPVPGGIFNKGFVRAYSVSLASTKINHCRLSASFRRRPSCFDGTRSSERDLVKTLRTKTHPRKIE